jgi:DNA-binding NarL/FixJ family response regulator
MTTRTAPGLPLTEREQEVVRLVASGLTNKQAARTLRVSVRTVDAHLRSAYVKTGTGTRTRLPLWLIQHGQRAR